MERDVWLYGHKIGKLVDTPDLEFTPTPEYLDDPLAPPIIHTDLSDLGETERYFSLLFRGHGLTGFRHRRRELFGAVQLTPRGSKPTPGRCEPLDDTALAAYVRAAADQDISQDSYIPRPADHRWVALADRGNGWERPRDGALSTHFFRRMLPAAALKILAEEATAAALGVPVVGSKLVQLEGERTFVCLVTPRVDRRVTDGQIEAIHAYDLASGGILSERRPLAGVQARISDKAGFELAVQVCERIVFSAAMSATTLPGFDLLTITGGRAHLAPMMVTPDSGHYGLWQFFVGNVRIDGSRSRVQLTSFLSVKFDLPRALVRSMVDRMFDDAERVYAREAERLCDEHPQYADMFRQTIRRAEQARKNADGQRLRRAFHDASLFTLG